MRPEPSEMVGKYWTERKAVLRCDQNEHGFARVQEVLNGTRSGPRVKITQDVRDYAAEKGIGVEVVVDEGMKAKAKEFREQGSEIYKNT